MLTWRAVHLHAVASEPERDTVRGADLPIAGADTVELSAATLSLRVWARAAGAKGLHGRW